MVMKDCPRCGRAQRPSRAAGQLLLWPPLGHSRDKIRSLLKKKGYMLTAEPEGACMVVTLEAGQLDKLCIYLNGALEGLEIRDTQALFIAGDAAPTLAQVGAVRPLNQLIAFTASDWLGEIIDSERLTTHFQPIFPVDRRDAPFAHECLVRATDADGNNVPPGYMFSTATDADLLFALDRAARSANVRNAMAAGIDTHVFINFSPSSVYDPANCLRTTVAVAEEVGAPRDRFVFEVVESDQIEDVEHLAGILSFYRKAGFKVALDDVGAGYASLNLLPTLKPDFIKIDRALVSGADGDSVKGSILKRLCQIARDVGIEVIAEGIETEGELAAVTEAGAHYAQGYLLGRPDPAPWSARLVA